MILRGVTDAASRRLVSSLVRVSLLLQVADSSGCLLRVVGAEMPEDRQVPRTSLVLFVRLLARFSHSFQAVDPDLVRMRSTANQIKAVNDLRRFQNLQRFVRSCSWGCSSFGSLCESVRVRRVVSTSCSLSCCQCVLYFVVFSNCTLHRLSTVNRLHNATVMLDSNRVT